MKYFSASKPTSAHRKLNGLERNHYIQSITSDSGEGTVWTLTRKGFNAISGGLPEMREAGFQSEAIGHDLLCMAAMVGEWIYELPRGVILYPEQFLRRIDSRLFPHWVPDSSTHRSDGYWGIPGKNKTMSSISLEVERHQKNPKSDEAVADFYQENPNVKSVLWITPMHSKGCAIARRFQSYLGKDFKKHQFIPLSKFKKDGWQTKIQIGTMAGKTISEFFGALVSPPRRLGDSRLLLETRKKPIILDPNAVSENHSFFT